MTWRVSALFDFYVKHLICTLRRSFLSQLKVLASLAPSINLAGIFMSVTYVYRSTTNNVTESLLPNPWIQQSQSTNIRSLGGVCCARFNASRCTWFLKDITTAHLFFWIIKSSRHDETATTIETHLFFRFLPWPILHELLSYSAYQLLSQCSSHGNGRCLAYLRTPCWHPSNTASLWSVLRECQHMLRVKEKFNKHYLSLICSFCKKLSSLSSRSELYWHKLLKPIVIAVYYLKTGSDKHDIWGEHLQFSQA